MISDNTSLEEFREMSCMTTRCYNACDNVGIKTFGDFMDHVFKMNHRNIGKNTFQEIISLKSKYKDERISCNSDIDWEKRRYYIAKSCINGILGNDEMVDLANDAGRRKNCRDIPTNVAEMAVAFADALIAELKKGGEK